MRRTFADLLFQRMEKNPKIWLICCDLGYRVWDEHFKAFPDRCINTGAAEQAAMGIAVGLALEGKIPFIYSITNFVLYRPFETVRNYLEHEKIPVKILAAGRDKDYEHDGISHQSEDAKKILDTLPNIVQLWPEKKEDMVDVMKETMRNNLPTFISLRR